MNKYRGSKTIKVLGINLAKQVFHLTPLMYMEEEG